MSEEKEIIQGAVDVTKTLIEKTSFYEDAIQPGAKEFGRAFQTIGKTVNTLLAPFSFMVRNYQQISGYLNENVGQKLAHIPQERLISPNISIAGPAIEALRFSLHENELREMYANLIATTMDIDTAQNAHPGFVQIIQNMSSDEAKIMKYLIDKNVLALPIIDVKIIINQDKSFRIGYNNFSNISLLAKCQYGNLSRSYINNLCRLGLLEVDSTKQVNPSQLYDVLEQDGDVQKINETAKKEGNTIEFDRKSLIITTFGIQFCKACVTSK